MRSDRSTSTINDVVTDNGSNVQRTRTYGWVTLSPNSLNLVSVSESSTDGLRSWWKVYHDPGTPALSSNRVVYASGSNRYVTHMAADGSFTVSVAAQRLSAPGKEVAAKLMPQVEALGVNTEAPLHAGGQIGRAANEVEFPALRGGLARNGMPRNFPVAKRRRTGHSDPAQAAEPPGALSKFLGPRLIQCFTSRWQFA